MEGGDELILFGMEIVVVVDFIMLEWRFNGLEEWKLGCCDWIWKKEKNVVVVS